MQRLISTFEVATENYVLDQLIEYATEAGIYMVEYGQNRENEERHFSMVFSDMISDFKNWKENK